MNIRSLLFSLLTTLSVCFLSAQERHSLDSLSFQGLEKMPSPPIKSNPFLIMPKENALDVFKNSAEFQEIPFARPTNFPTTWAEFKIAFLTLSLPNEFALVERFYHNMESGKKYQLQPSLWLTEEEMLRRNSSYQPPIPGGAVIVSVSIFQELYDQYSHEGKMKRKYDNLVRQDDIERTIAEKYDVEVVKQSTGFNDSTALSFMKFCDFKKDSLLQANNYDILIMIQDCMGQFILSYEK